MGTLDNEGFETYLKQFRPIVPDALPLTEGSRRSTRRRLLLPIWVAGATAMLTGTVEVRVGSAAPLTNAATETARGAKNLRLFMMLAIKR